MRFDRLTFRAVDYGEPQLLVDNVIADAQWTFRRRSTVGTDLKISSHGPSGDAETSGQRRELGIANYTQLRAQRGVGLHENLAVPANHSCIYRNRRRSYGDHDTSGCCRSTISRRSRRRTV